MRKGFMYKGMVVCMILLAVIIVTDINQALAAEDETLSIMGDGVTTPIEFTREALEVMQDDYVQYIYSSQNNYPTKKLIAAEGIPLSILLEKAGIKPEAQLITVKAFDGYAITFTRQEILEDNRYYFPGMMQDDSQGAEPVKTIIALKLGDGKQGISGLQEDYFKLCMGQRAVTEQTNPWFVKNTALIEVSTKAPEKWDSVTTKTSQGTITAGTNITLDLPDFNKAKIYYTLDGSQPTVNSPMFNISTTYWQPELNVPIVLERDTTIKAVAIGAGKLDSAIVSFEYTIAKGDRERGQFSDLQGFEWAQTAIEDLADKQIINGMAKGQFAPEGILTRAQFAKITVGALYGEPDAIESSRFSDIDGNAWYGKYVEKAAQEGLINGFDDGRFGPDQSLTNEQMIAIVIRAMGKNDAASNLNGAGLSTSIRIDTVSNWAKGYVELAEQEGLLETQHLEGPLIANEAATRAEAAEIVYRMLGKR